MADVTSPGLSDVAQSEQWARKLRRMSMAEAPPDEADAEPAQGRRTGLLRAVALWGGLGLMLAATLALFTVRLDWLMPAPAQTVRGKGDHPAVRFAETRTGELVFILGNGERCRRLLFDNDTGMMQDLGQGPCAPAALEAKDTPSAAAATATTGTGSTDRIGGIRGGFKR